MDALFGLPRKKSAGVSHRDPLLKDVFFYDQLEVDRFVSAVFTTARMRFALLMSFNYPRHSCGKKWKQGSLINQ